MPFSGERQGVLLQGGMNILHQVLLYPGLSWWQQGLDACVLGAKG